MIRVYSHKNANAGCGTLQLGHIEIRHQEWPAKHPNIFDPVLVPNYWYFALVTAQVCSTRGPEIFVFGGAVVYCAILC